MHTPSSASAEKPKALFLSPEAPYPPIGGGPLRSASVLEYLARSYRVHAIVFREPGAADPARAVPAGRIDRLDVLNLPYHSKHPIARVLRNSLRVLRNSPPLLDRFSGFGGPIAGLVSGRTYAIAVVEHFWCAPYVEQLRPQAQRVILDLHNIESVWHQRLAASERGVRAYALRRFAAASRTLEREWLPKFDSILAPSAQEAESLRLVAPAADVVVYPNSLPEVLARERSDREEIVFSGNLEYPPNIEAIRFFKQYIWPLLRTRHSLKWKIVGKNPDAIRHIVRDDPRIELTGFVEDAIASLTQARVAVVPLLSGSGTRIKILEAWAAATPVVSTRLGAEGLCCRDGEHLLMADEPGRFAAAVSGLLDSPAQRARIGSAGRRLYEEHYTWPVAWRSLDAVLGNGARP